MYIPLGTVGDVTKFFAMPQSGSYYCCDVYEPGSGYMFTDCGGMEVFINRDKLQDAMSLEFRNQPLNLIAMDRQ